MFAEFAHLPALARRQDVELRWIIAAHEEHARARATQWGAKLWSTDYRRPLSDPGVDAVIVCLPSVLHASVAVEALNSGKDVLLEKPLALSTQDGLRVAAAAESSGRCLMVAENWLFSSALRKARDELATGRIGAPFLVRASHQTSFRLDADPDPGVGWLSGAGTHVISAVRHLVGEVANVCAVSRQGAAPMEIDVAIAAEFASGCIGSIDLTGRSRHLGDRRLQFAVFGEEGVIEFDIWSGVVRVTTVAGEIQLLDRAPSRGFDEELAHFIDCLASREQPLTSVQDQLRTVAVIEAAYRSLETGRLERVVQVT